VTVVVSVNGKKFNFSLLRETIKLLALALIIITRRHLSCSSDEIREHVMHLVKSLNFNTAGIKKKQIYTSERV
jgi:hypothetical protein